MKNKINGQKIPSEVISLIHHVTLNESGWWDKIVQSLIISVFGIKKNEIITTNDIKNCLYNDYGIEIDIARFDKQIQILLSKKKLVIPFKGCYKLSDDAFSEFQIDFETQINIEEKTKAIFINLINEKCPDLDAENVWNKFNKDFILPLIKETGAKSYEFISGESSRSLPDYKYFKDFVNSFRSTNLNDIIVDFLNPKDETVKAYIIHQLNSYFFLEATNLDENTINTIYSLSKTQTNLKIFVDTNFLLSLLDLHDNPSNDATQTLLSLITEIKNRVNIKFYVLPITIHEFKNLIGRNVDKIKKMRMSMPAVKASIQSDTFSGIIKKYFDKCISQNQVISPDTYFDIYLNNFNITIRKRGIELFNKSEEGYAVKQKVVDDILEQVEYRMRGFNDSFEKKQMTKEEVEYYEKNLEDKFRHDSIIWHMVREMRPTYVESPKDIVNWIATLDFKFLEFDKYKQDKDSNHKVSVCLHPNELISMLQFWIPRTQKFEEAILGNLQLPFLFKDIDKDSQAVSVEILKVLSHYEKSDDFTSEFITEILTNNALRHKIKPSKEIEENAKLIKEEIFEWYKEKEEELVRKKKHIENQQTKLQQAAVDHSKLEDKLKNVNTKVDDLSQKITDLLNTIKTKSESDLNIRKANIKNNLEQRKRTIESEIKQLDRLVEKNNDSMRKADDEIQEREKSITTFIKNIFRSEVAWEKEKQAIKAKFYNIEIIQKDKDDLSILKNELKSINDKLDSFIDGEKVTILCENKNEKYFNQLNLNGVKFIPVNNSFDVFTKTSANPQFFGLRDRDYLSDTEVEKLKNTYSNYFILDYYCFENYLYHPDNIESMNIEGFNKSDYVKDIVEQKENDRRTISANLVAARRNYEEFKVSGSAIKDKNAEEFIIKSLESEDFETFYKYYDMKKYYKKKIPNKFFLKEEQLASAEWFKQKFYELLQL